MEGVAFMIAAFWTPIIVLAALVTRAVTPSNRWDRHLLGGCAVVVLAFAAYWMMWPVAFDRADSGESGPVWFDPTMTVLIVTGFLGNLALITAIVAALRSDADRQPHRH